MAIKVFIIDDSMVFREIIRRGIQISDDIHVVGVATDPFDASEQILELNPDVITCDIEMPKMDGIEFVKRLLPQFPVPVIVVSSISERVFDAMDAGAVDFVTKPNASSPEDVQRFIFELTREIREASKAKVEVRRKRVEPAKKQVKAAKHHKIIAIGASTGGTEAIFNVLKQLPQDIPGIVIVQHIPPLFSTMFAERLDLNTHFQVKEAENGDIVEKGHVYVAPGDKHLEVRSVGETIKLVVKAGEKVTGHCPSVDVLFTSVAKNLGDKAIGVILTGMGYDGAKGITMMRRKGAYTIGQDHATCVVYGMPKAAYDLGGIERQTALERVGYQIMNNMR